MIQTPDFRYPIGTVRALMDGEHVTASTRAALQARLAGAAATHGDVLGKRVALLAAVCSRLVPQTTSAPIDLAGTLHARLATGIGNGWRYADLPPDSAAFRRGLDGIDETAQAMFETSFISLVTVDQDAVLSAVQTGAPHGASWRALPAARFFETLLVAVVETYYAHPLAQEEIGYVGMADAPGWHAIGLGEREMREPAEIAN